MTNSQILKERIRSSCKNQGKEVTAMLVDLSLGINAVNQINEKKGMGAFSLAKIADYLGVSVDYLLGRTENPNPQNINNSISATDINGDNVQSISSGVISQRDRELLDKINSLNFDDYADIISYINSKIKSAG